MFSHLKEIFDYKEMIKSLVKKELRTRYKGSVLGFLWTFVNPILQVFVYSLILPYVMRVNEVNYTMFLFVAMIPWNYFTSSLQGSAGQIVYNSNLVEKVYFPREVLPISYSISGLCNLFFGYIVVLLVLPLFGVSLTINILWVPLLFLIQFIMCTGISLFVSSVNVYFRDIEHIIGIIIMALYFMTPIMYPLGTLPEKLQKLVLLNPMAGLILSYRKVMYEGVTLDFGLLIYPTVFSIAMLVMGYIVFGKLQKNFTEVL